jgi:hypothetical protein
MWKGVFAGAVGGLLGSWAMSEAQRLWTRLSVGSAPHSAGEKHDSRDWQERIEHQNANELAAQAIANGIIGRRLTHEELRWAARATHHGFGAVVGALYGAYAKHRRGQRLGLGFGAIVWLAADEIAMPMLGLSQSTVRRPIEMHLQSLFAHFAYGATTELVRRPLDAAFASPRQ